MRIGIIGPAERAVAWEDHLSPHPSVTEVIIAPTLRETGSIQACLLLDDSPGRHEQLLEAIKAGYHTFFISKLPTDKSYAEKVYHASQEANVRVQFSHWPTLAPASQWMVQKVKKPSFIQVVREISHSQFIENNMTFRDLWVDELAYCLKYGGGAVHHTDLNFCELHSGTPHATHLTLRFDSGATASIFISTCGRANTHKRLVSDRSTLLDCDVEAQTVRMGREQNEQHLFFDKKTFDPSQAAEQAVARFLKAIQLKKASLYTSYDLLQLTTLLGHLDRRP